MTGRIFLVPVTLGSTEYRSVIPEQVLEQTIRLRYFVVENLRSARRYLRMIDRTFPVDETIFMELNEHTAESDTETFFEPLFAGHDIGLMSEAGLPGIADPGNILIAAAHRKNVKVVPLSGPSSIILSLISSGMNGQSFSFRGYLPVKQNELTSALKDLEKRSKSGETQIFIETPYRALKTFRTILDVCNPMTRLCVASNISLEDEDIRTRFIDEWRKNPPAIEDRLVVFLLQA